MKLFDVYPLYDITPVKGKGAFVYDDKGTAYLDLYGGHAVISIGHAHSHYVEKLRSQLQDLGFYSNSIKNPLQEELAEKLENAADIKDYSLFLCNSGAEANENALKLASFHTGKSDVIYFDKAFHGRTSAAVAVTDNEGIKAPLNQLHKVTKLAFEDIAGLESELKKGETAAVILEVIQGVGGLDEASTSFYQKTAELCEKYGAVLIADEVQSGYGRTGDFFAYQKHGIRPGIISIAKGMGNGFPIGGILIDSSIPAKHGMLGTTFGGNHLACAAGIAVLEVLENEELLKNAKQLFEFVQEEVKRIPQIKQLKGRGLMLGLEFDFEIAALRKTLLFEHHIFTGASSNKKLLRILPPLNIEKKHFEMFFEALKAELNK
ncbi:aminotransferase class III-fold pyridoxal phosphate-dependent enzyme [Gillisia sp. M10.2A]|uniref:Aminotransferase class III-fold pyridoxal phosphate-dependent enzyme n=1 Tax=Gillisia lutea TaxID=2909668 RepID=A0ABS9EIB0_9FLAO|nr:aminotransferase class III-fold pyridoxal phosphate-dependent enzyme [Gillisia lutea]MCF4102595.1 aminotransferase class III-fold pyridoxal phosphate-dependent enzyme [Gillisia lutea]